MKIRKCLFNRQLQKSTSTTGVTGCGLCYPVCGKVHIKELLLLICKSSPCNGSSVFPFSLSGPLPHVSCHKTVNKMC